MQPPQLSVVLLTWNEEANIEACLSSLADQTTRDFEVIVVDAASRDGTVAIVRRMQSEFPVPLRLEASQKHLHIGEARNRGVALAAATKVAFLSADLDVDERWVHEALRALESHDMVFGRQVHAPHRWTLGAAVRGLRYRFPRGAIADPLPFASNVGAAYQKAILERHPFDAWANAAEDLLLARRAVADGAQAMYDPHMIVRHHDVADAPSEWRKNVREGRGWGIYRKELGLLLPMLAWAIALLAALLILAFPPALVTHSMAARIAPLLAVTWLPALRRGLRRHPTMPARHRLMAVAASPAFDLAFLANYLLALTWRPEPARARPAEVDAG